MAASTKDRVQGELGENIVAIRRCATVVKGGRRFSFAAMVVVGDGKGKVGWGYGKANEVPPSVEKARKEGMRSMVDRAARRLDDSAQGRGLLRRGPRGARARFARYRRDRRARRCEPCAKSAGIHDILTKSFGSNNPVSLVKATFAALAQLRPKQDVERLRGVTLS